MAADRAWILVRRPGPGPGVGPTPYPGPFAACYTGYIQQSPTHTQAVSPFSSKKLNTSDSEGANARRRCSVSIGQWLVGPW
jgi:hypothetical protein